LALNHEKKWVNHDDCREIDSLYRANTKAAAADIENPRTSGDVPRRITPHLPAGFNYIFLWISSRKSQADLFSLIGLPTSNKRSGTYLQFWSRSRGRRTVSLHLLSTSLRDFLSTNFLLDRIFDPDPERNSIRLTARRYW
jgi:hypothetical protein